MAQGKEGKVYSHLSHRSDEQTKGREPPGLLKPFETHTKSWSTITMDLITDLPSSKEKTVIWMVMDAFSKQAHFVPFQKLPTLAKLFGQHVI